MQNVLTPAAFLLFGVALNAQTVPIYNTLPSPLPSSLTSQSFEAGFISEFGDQIQFGGTGRRLTSVTVSMVTWGYFSKYNAPGTANSGGWTHPITLNLYAVNASDPNHPGNVIGSVTQTFFVPWRPEPTPSCGGTLWLASDGCHNGMAFPITFDFSGLSLTLPNQIIFGIAYNTQIAGRTPIGVNGPYNDLNVGLNNSYTVGSNPIFPEAFLNGTINQAYADNGVGGINVYRRDVGSTHTNIAIQFNIPVPPPALITVTGGGMQTATVGTPFGSALQARVTDAGGNASAGVPVTFTAPGSGASATLSPSSVITDSNGIASVAATANATPGSYAVTAGVSGVTPAAFNLTNVAGSVQTFVFLQQPTNTAAGNPISPPVTVKLADSYNNPIANASVTMSLQETGVTLGGTLTQNTNAGGIATFGDLKITQAGTYHLQATTGSMTALSTSFNVGATRNGVLITVYDGDGQSASVGTTYGAPLKALVQDQFNNIISGAAVTFSAPPNGASVTFAAATTVTTDAGGIATSPAITANTQAGAFQVSAATTDALSPAQFNLNNVPGAANKLTFVQQPANTAAGSVIVPPVTVQLQDASGNAVRTAAVPITIQSNAVVLHLHLLSGNATQNTDANGLATFANLSISQVGTYQFLATAAGVASATSNPFNITAGGPTTIQSTGGTPQSAIVQTVYGAPLQVTVTDTAGNPVSGVPVKFAAPTSGPSGLFGGQPTATVNTDVQGHAAAVITANSIAGTFGVTASSTAITGTALFDLTNLSAGSSSLVFVQQPTSAAAGQIIAPPVTVQVRDGSGNAMQVSGVPVFLSLSSGTGAIFGTVVQLTASTGLATFNDLQIGAVGTKTLRAASPQQAPVSSNPFQIIAGAPASTTVLAGSPQATNVSQQFPALLQTRVTDLAGNPVSGVSVVFALPSGNGPSGAFSGPTTVATDANGIATAPILTANTSPGNFAVTATAAGVGSPAVFALTNLPQQSSALVVTPSSLSFVSEINQAAPSGQVVQISASGTVTWTVSASESWLAAVPASGTGTGQITVSVNPAGLSVGNYSGFVRIGDSSGSVTLVLVTYTIGGKPVLVISPPLLVFTTPGNTIAPAVQMLKTTSSSRTIAYSVSAKVSTPSGGNWLQVSTSQGETPGSVTVTANPANLSSGVYDGAVLFSPTDNTLNSVAVPVTLIVGCGQGGCQLQPTILSVVNAASFQPGGAPRAIMTIFGTNLSDAIYLASSYPLPTQLGPTSVTVNGTVVPLFFVSPTQINFQMPGSAPASGIQVVVNNQATASNRSLRASEGHPSALTVVDPGLFVTPDKRAAALNGDLSAHSAATPIPAGGYVILFITGEGSVTPTVPDGAPAAVSPLSVIDAPAQVTIGGKSAQVTYQGLAPGYAGLAQINAIVPSGLTPGDQPVFVTVGGVASNSGLITVK
jgi:adhesin/invasin